MRLLCILLLASGARADRCIVPEDVAGFERNLPPESSLRGAALTLALANDPDNFTLNRLVLDTKVYERVAVRAKYRQLSEAHPDSIDLAYLYARSLVGSDTPGALKIYSRITARDPEYPWVYLSLLEIYRSDAFRDRKKLTAAFAAIRRICPSELRPYEYLADVEEGELVASEAQRLRNLLVSSTDFRSLKLYRSLWAAEFRTLPKDQHDAERSAIAADLKRLQPYESLRGIRTVMAHGAVLAGAEELASEIAAKAPPDLSTERRKWQESHPYPQPNDPTALKLSYANAQLKASSTWIEQAPQDPIGYYDRLQALVTLEAPAIDLANAGEQLLNIERRKEFEPPSFFLTVARAYLDRGVRLEQVPIIIEEAIVRLEDPEAVIDIDLAPNPGRAAVNRMTNIVYHAEAVSVLAEFYEKQGRPSKAREALRLLEEYLTAKATANDEKNLSVVELYRSAQSAYWYRLAALDDHEGRKLDALFSYHQASAYGNGSDSVLAAQRKLWKELGGSEEGWNLWTRATVRKDPTEADPERPKFKAVNRRLPDFSSLEDVLGDNWPSQRFKAKITVAVVWATWCAPCIEELPYLARLAEKTRNDDTIQVVSFNIDDNTGAVEAFLRQRNYSFPVLLAKHFVEDLLPDFVIPRTWIVQDGVLRAEMLGFGGNRESWTDNVMAQVQRMLPRSNSAQSRQ